MNPDPANRFEDVTAAMESAYASRTGMDQFTGELNVYGHDRVRN